MAAPIQKVDPKKLEKEVLNQIEKSTDSKKTVSDVAMQFSLWKRSVNLPTSFIDRKDYIKVRETAIEKMEDKGYDKELVEIFRKLTKISNLPIVK
jgi:hypothetical protein